MVSITPNQLVRYYAYPDTFRRHKHTKKELHNLTLNNLPHEISDKTRRKIRKAVNWLVAISADHWFTPVGKDYTFKVKIAFVTLTLPSAQVHCDKVITKECLNQLLVELRKYHQVKNYVWKAEAQANGNIHYHIAIDHPVQYNKLRDRWNRIIKKLGYIENFEKKHNHLNPNSTDIHKVQDVENMAAYISEYMAKKESKRPICGAVWNCSQTISRCESVKVMEDSFIQKELTDIVNSSNAQVKQMDYCQMIWPTNDSWTYNTQSTIAKEYRKYIQQAKSDKLESKTARISKVQVETVDSSLMAGLALTQILESKIIQSEQLCIFDNAVMTEASEYQKINRPNEYNLQYYLQHKNFHPNNPRETELIPCNKVHPDNSE